MIQYLCENFDTRRLRLAGVSSGAIAAVLLLSLEEETSAVGVRRKALEVFALVERVSAPLFGWPLGFLSRLGSLLEEVTQVLPENCNLCSRLRVGVRKLALDFIPAAVPAMVTGLKTRESLIEAVLASSTVWLVVRKAPYRYLSLLKAYCSDGVNPFSFYCFFEYLQHRLSSLACRTAPANTHSRGLDVIYAIWNCGVMRVLLPQRGRYLWVTPTMGGRLDLCYCLRFSSWFITEQWRQGYKHARDLDEQGYWNLLTRRS